MPDIPPPPPHERYAAVDPVAPRPRPPLVGFTDDRSVARAPVSGHDIPRRERGSSETLTSSTVLRSIEEVHPQADDVSSRPMATSGVTLISPASPPPEDALDNFSRAVNTDTGDTPGSSITNPIDLDALSPAPLQTSRLASALYPPGLRLIRFPIQRVRSNDGRGDPQSSRKRSRDHDQDQPDEGPMGRRQRRRA